MCQASCSQCNHGYCPTGAEVRYSQNVTHSNVRLHFIQKLPILQKRCVFFFFLTSVNTSLYTLQGLWPNPFYPVITYHGRPLSYAVCGASSQRPMTLPRIASSPGSITAPGKQCLQGHGCNPSLLTFPKNQTCETKGRRSHCPCSNFYQNW